MDDRRHRIWKYRFLLGRNFINTLFSNDNFYLKTLRELGMNAVDKSDLLKSFFVKEAAGEYGNLPALLKQ